MVGKAEKPSQEKAPRRAPAKVIIRKGYGWRKPSRRGAFCFPQKMKIKIKKRYLVSIASLISVGIGGYYLQELWRIIYNKSLSILIVPLIFLFTTIYVINYFLRLRQDEKLINEVSKEISKGDSGKFEQLKNHIWDKVQEESYSINLFNKIKK
ncbi:MAG: hypothetical protein ABIG91_04110 [Patescibacteria group bacterium]